MRLIRLSLQAFQQRFSLTDIAVLVMIVHVD